jgi:ferredoxin
MTSFRGLAAVVAVSQCAVQSFSFTSTCTPRFQRHDFHLPPDLNRVGTEVRQRQMSRIFLSNDSEGYDESSDVNDGSIDINSDERLRRIRLPRATGIEWGTDLSFSFVYVRDLEPSGAAAFSGEVKVGDQICELRPVIEGGGNSGDGNKAVGLIGAPFDEVMNAFASLGRTVKDVDLVFFRGSKDELKAACKGGSLSDEDEKVMVTVIQNKGSKDEQTRYIEAKTGCNVRQLLTDNGINVYQSVTRWTNCKGKQLCGTCIVNIADGAGSTNRKSLDEGSTLRENPESYRLSCVTFAYGDITVETFPPIKAAQWTR